MRDTRKEMSVFLTRQTVRRRRDWMSKLRQAERILLSVSIVLAGLASVYGLYQLVFLGSTFSVRKIVVEGNWRYLTAGALAELSGVNEGENLFWVKVGEVHKRLKANPWVKATAVQRRLPGTLWIYVEEHAPVALLSGSDGLYSVDADGVVFKRVEAGDDKKFSVLTGAEPKQGEDGEFEADPRIREMLSIIDLFKNTDLGRDRDVSEVHYDGMRGYSLITKKEPMQIFFGHAALEERIGQLSRMFGAATRRPGRIQYMLANEPGRIIVKYHTS